MAKRKKKVDDIEVVDEQVVKPRPQPKTNAYPLKKDLKVGGKWKRKGETIKLTESQYRDFRSKKIV